METENKLFLCYGSVLYIHTLQGTYIVMSALCGHIFGHSPPHPVTFGAWKLHFDKNHVYTSFQGPKHTLEIGAMYTV